jgi:hypothetical protein
MDLCTGGQRGANSGSEPLTDELIVDPELPLHDLRTILKEKRGLRGEAAVADAGEVRKHIGTIWKNAVVLRTIYDGAPLLVRCNRDGQTSVEPLD